MLTSERPKLLIVDDVADNVELLAACLQDFCELRFALSGPECLALVGESRPDLILLDVMMPGMDGYEVCDLLRHDPATRDIPVIFVTARTDAESESRALAGGASDFIHKPINRDVVRARVRRTLELETARTECLDARLHLAEQVAERTAALHDALRRAEKASQAKSHFLANLSHELRTPLHGILGLARILERKVADPALHNGFRHIDAAGHQLLDVINDLLEATRLEAGRYRLETQDFDLLTLLTACEERLQPRLAKKDLLLVREIDPAVPRTLHGDPLRIAQVLNHLLDNAEKFSERGCITLRCRVQSATADHLKLIFEIEDQGHGISPEDQQRIFDLFEQGDNSPTRRFGGCGLGLAISRNLVELMSGRLTLDSVVGRGSLIRIELPLLTGQQDVAGDASSAAGQALHYLHRLVQEEDSAANAVWLGLRRLLLDSVAETQLQAVDQALDTYDFAAAAELLASIRAARADNAKLLEGNRR